MKTPDKVLWLTDTHVWDKQAFLDVLLEEDPDIILHSGDLTEGPMLEGLLEFLGEHLGDRKLIFTTGNHEHYFSDIETTNTKVRAIANKYANLTWIDEAGIVPLTNDTAVLGGSGWCDATSGNRDLLFFSLDWLLIKDFRVLPNMEARLQMFQDLAQHSATLITARLEEAFKTYQTVYLLTHFPLFAGTFEAAYTYYPEFWVSYNTNHLLGQSVEKVMEGHPDKQLVVLSGHVHCPDSRILGKHSNIIHRIGRSGFRFISDDERIHL